MSRLRCFLVTLSALVLLADPARVGAQWRADLQAGRLQYDNVPRPAVTTAVLGLERATRTSAFGVAAGVPFSRQDPIWLAVDGYRRISAGTGFQVGVDLAGSAFGYHRSYADTSALGGLRNREIQVNGYGASIEAMPLVAVTGGRVSAEARGGVLYFTSASDDVAAYDRTALIGDARIAARLLDDLSARVEARWVSVPEGIFPYSEVGFVWARSGAVWASIGRWFDDAVTTFAWEGGASIPLSDRVALSLSARHDPIDPVYATPARTSWGAGFTVTFGSAATRIVEPVPASYENGVATIALAAGEVNGTPSVAGDFNDWTPTPMQRQGGEWILRLPLEPGIYNYAYVQEDGTWFVPEGTPGRRPDGMGGWTAVLVVEG